MKQRKSSKLIIGMVLVALGVGLLVWSITAKKADAPSHDHHNHSAANDHDHEHQTVDQSDVKTNGETAEIVFTDDGFEPKEITVSKGTTVTVKNSSSKNVQFSSGDHPTHMANPEMNLRELSPGESASFTAVTAGEHSFHDHIDASNTGTLTVE